MTKPCPSFVILKDGTKVYCEQGPKGHPGTCCGARTETEYRVLVRP